MSTNNHLPEQPVRSKGHATLLASGHPTMNASVRDISAAGIGVVAAESVAPGTAVDIHIHDHSAHGVVQSCEPAGNEFYIAITLAA